MPMPSPKHPCPDCGTPTRAKRCRRCTQPYERTAENRAKMSAALKGKPHNYRSGGSLPGVALKIKAWWTPDRKEERRQELLQRNPSARYHGLSSRQAARIVRSAGKCERCPSKKRLGIHHKDRNKKNQERSNLEVLCHRCHMRDHSAAGETGWQRYHAKRKALCIA